MKNKHNIIAFAALVIIGGVIVVLESRQAARPGVSSGDTGSGIEIPADDLSFREIAREDNAAMSADARAQRVREKSARYERAKEITTPDGFINTDGVRVADLAGKKVILVDFWTYSCINCQRTLPYLNSWYEKYADRGLVILGVHTPEFEFEKVYENVKRAVEKFGVKYPVILDNDYSTWTAYQNRYWPRKYLIDIDGFIVYDHIGEGGYEETEQKIVALLNERSETLGEAAVAMIDMPVSADAVDFLKVKTPETYLGYSRSQYLANLPSQACLDAPCDFIKPDNVKLNTFALSGKWEIDGEEASLVEGQGEVIIRFSANKVNFVAGATEGGVPAKILLDGKSIDAAVAGSDVRADGTVLFGAHDLYNLVDLRGDYGEHELIIRFLEPAVRAFAFTFG